MRDYKTVAFYDTHDVFSYRSIGIGFFAEAVVPVASNSVASRMMRVSFISEIRFDKYTKILLFTGGFK